MNYVWKLWWVKWWKVGDNLYVLNLVRNVAHLLFVAAWIDSPNWMNNKAFVSIECSGILCRMWNASSKRLFCSYENLLDWFECYVDFMVIVNITMMTLVPSTYLRQILGLMVGVSENERFYMRHEYVNYNQRDWEVGYWW